MIALALAVLVVALYFLGMVATKELTDMIEEREQDFLPRDAYWRFIFTWPYQILVGLFTKEPND